MNKLFMFIAVLGLQVFSISASDKQEKFEPIIYTYQSSSLKPTEIIKTNLTTGQQEIILVSPGQSQKEKTAELMLIEAMAWMRLKQNQK